MGKLGKFQVIVTWEQRKLGELGTLRRGKSKHRPRNDPKLFGGDYPFIQTGDVASSGLYLQNFTQTLNNFGLTQSKLWNKGTLVITIAANVADSAILAIDAAFPDSVIGFTSETSSVEFDKFLLDGLSDELKRTAPTGSQANLNLEILSNTSEYVPSISEQGKIARFLIQFEDTIALHERKLELLKELKKAYLQQLFPKNGDKAPQLRFAGFTDDWEQRMLSEVSKRITRKNSNLESTLPLTISAQYGLIDQNDFFNKQVASKDVSGYFLVKKGEFAYNKSYSKDYPWGAIKRLNNYDQGVLSTLYIVFSPTNIESDFLASYYDSDGWYREISKNATEGARNHGLLNISPTDFFDIKLPVPAESNEQVAITKLLSNLNNTIALHESKFEQLNNLKRAFLQKLYV